MKKITLAESRTTNWSGGTSTELWIDPPGSSYAARDFDYRISTATIEADESTFTPLPGFDRILAVLTNEIALDINDESRVLQPGELLHFRGEDAVRSAGRTRDFNLISRRGKPVNCFQLEGEVKGPALVFDKTDLSLTILDSGERVEFGPCIVIELETIQLPESIRTVVAGMRSEPVGVGMTTARVIRYSDDYKSYYLKVDSGAEIRNEKRILDFLHGKLPVPEVIGYIEGETSYLLTTAMQGEMAFLADRQAALRALFEGLRQVRAVPIGDCPVDAGIDVKLAEARARLDAGLIDPDVTDPEGLFARLVRDKPVEAPCFSHGDYCLPNVFVSGGRAVGFIDLGRAGVGSHWNDLALCFRSYLRNFPEGSAEEFEAAYGEPIDWELIRYYIDLDELF